MPESTVIRTKRDVTWVIQDAGAANSYTPPKVLGDFAYEAPLYDLVRILDNGSLDSLRKGDDQPTSVSWTQHLSDVGSTTYATIVDITEERGFFLTDWTSTTDLESDVLTSDLVATIDGTAFGEADKSLTFADMVFRGSKSFGYPASISVSGESATATKPTLS
jgi:hypothetical protein